MPLPRPKEGEARGDFVDRCMSDEAMLSEFPDGDQRSAVCYQQFTTETNAKPSLKPPQSVVNNYKRGLELHEEGKTGDGLEPGTVRVARDIVAGESVTEDWARKANRWWGRNERFLKEPSDSPAYASAMLWGGAAGRDWYRSVVKKLEANSDLTESADSALKKKVEDHNEKYGDDKSKRATLSMLRAVYRRGVGAYETNPESVHEGVKSAEQWALGRVNAFLRILAGSRTSTLFDTDLLPDGHPKKSKEKNMALEAGQTIRANIRTAVNSEMIRREQRDGRDVVVVKSATLPDDIIMNGILYPAEEIEASYKTLEDTPAPLGHPTVNNMFVSAKSPLGLNIGYFGAFNANVQRTNGKVYVEKVIDIQRANESAMGRRVLAALEQGRPIHTSTGLTMNLRECTRSDLAEVEGYNMEFDHDAILLDEDGAATPEQGVGMLVNAAQTADGKPMLVVNSDYEVEADPEATVDYLGMELVSAMSRRQTASQWERVKSAVRDILGLGREELGTMRKEAMNMAEKDEDMKGYEKMAARMDKLEERMNKMDEAIANMGKKADAANALVEAMNAEKEAAKAALVNKVVEAKLLSEDDAKEMPVKALEVMMNAAKPKASTPAPGIAGGFMAQNGADVDFSPLAEVKQ